LPSKKGGRQLSFEACTSEPGITFHALTTANRSSPGTVVATKNLIRREMTAELANRVIIRDHAWNGRIAASLADVSRRRLQAENLVLRHQVNILGRRASRRLRLSNTDRLAFVWLYRLCPSVVDAVAIIKPETLIRWHRRGFKAFWRWKSRSRGGRPPAPGTSDIKHKYTAE
jgi:hypothetical protein